MGFYNYLVVLLCSHHYQWLIFFHFKVLINFNYHSCHCGIWKQIPWIISSGLITASSPPWLLKTSKIFRLLWNVYNVCLFSFCLKMMMIQIRMKTCRSIKSQARHLVGVWCSSCEYSAFDTFRISAYSYAISYCSSVCRKLWELWVCCEVEVSGETWR